MSRRPAPVLSLDAARLRRQFDEAIQAARLEPRQSHMVQAGAIPGLVVLRIPGLPMQTLSPAAARTWARGLLQLADSAEAGAEVDGG